MGIKLTNNAFATLAAGINSSATSITLTTGQGARFPTLSAGDYFYATLVDTSNNLEIVKCTARSTDVLTVTRAQEGTTARAYSAGDRIEIRVTAQTFLDATAVTPAAVSDQANTSTGYFDLPAGTTAQRPGSPGAGMVRFNTTTGEPEWYDPAAAQWTGFSKGANYSIEYLVVAGGGGASSTDVNNGTGGGGAGGVITGSYTVTAGVISTIVVGGGGAAATQSNGSNSTMTTPSVTAVGGGYGSFVTVWGANSGGSGGGGDGYSSFPNAGAGTSGQGNSGGNGSGTSSQPRRGGGGGGAGAAGQAAQSSVGGAGGAGYTWSDGVTYAGGGGGSGSANGGANGGAGGSGGGGAGAGANNSYVATAGTANTGGGAGGATNSGTARAGGSGVVIIRYTGTPRGSGGSVTQSGGYTYHTFTSSGTFTA